MKFHRMRPHPVEIAPYLGDLLLSQQQRANTQRRAFLAGLTVAAAAATGLLIPWPAASAAATVAATQQVHDLRGLVTINGVRATKDSVIAPGDVIMTGSDGYFVFVIGESAFMLRSRSELVVEKPAVEAYGAVYGLLRMVSGALGATFRRGTSARLQAANATIGIRGTGVYIETRGNGVYFCTCWGKTEIFVTAAPSEKEWVEAEHHSPRLISAQKNETGYFMSAPFETHSDDEMDILEKCVGRRAPWIKK